MNSFIYVGCIVNQTRYCICHINCVTVQNPEWAHQEALKHIFRYLMRTMNLELVYGGDVKRSNKRVFKTSWSQVSLSMICVLRELYYAPGAKSHCQ